MARKKPKSPVLPPKLRCLLPLLGLATGLLAFKQAQVGLTNDTKVLFHYASLLLSEGGLYDRWQEVNPPLIFLLYTVPVWLSQHLGLAPATALNIFTLLLCGGSVAAVWHALSPLDKPQRQAWTWGAAFILVVLPASCFVFTDREHLLFIFALPWILPMLLGIAPKPYTAALAAIGFFIKPYNVLICAALLLSGGPKAKRWQERIFSPSALVFAALGIAYLAVIFLFFRGYVTTTLPLLLTVYHHIGKDAAEQLWKVPVAAMIGGAFLWRLEFPRAPFAFLASCVLVYLLNGGWIYTVYLMAVPCLALALQAYLAQDGKFTLYGGGAAVAAAALASLYAANLNLAATRSGGYGWNYNLLPAGFVQEMHREAGKEYVLLSTVMWATNLSDTGKPPKHVHAYDSLWPLPWLVANPRSPRAPMVRDAIAHELLRALKTKPVLIVDDSPVRPHMPDKADLMQILKRDVRLKKPLGAYKRSRVIDKCDKDWWTACRFSVWKAQ